MLRGDLQASPTAIYDPLTGNADGTGRSQFQVFPGDPNYALCNTATNPSCLNIIPAARMDPIAQKIAAAHPRKQPQSRARQLLRVRSVHVRSPAGGFQGRLQRQFQAQSGRTFGVLHYATSVPTVFGDTGVGTPIGGSSNPGHGHGNTYRFTVMGTYIFSPTFLMDAHYGYARQGTSSEQPGLGTNIGSGRAGDSRHERPA